jgi:hypothetical protein
VLVLEQLLDVPVRVRSHDALQRRAHYSIEYYIRNAVPGPPGYYPSCWTAGWAWGSVGGLVVIIFLKRPCKLKLCRLCPRYSCS